MEIKGFLPVPLGNTDMAKQDFFPLKINIYTYILQYITENSLAIYWAAGAAKTKLASPKPLVSGLIFGDTLKMYMHKNASRCRLSNFSLISNIAAAEVENW